MPRAASASACVAVALLAAAPSVASASEPIRIRDTVETVYTAIQHRDGATACRLLTPRLGREIGSIDRPRGHHLPCARAIVRQFGGFPVPPLRSLRFDGPEATVTLDDDGHPASVDLVKRHGRWLMDDI